MIHKKIITKQSKSNEREEKSIRGLKDWHEGLGSINLSHLTFYSTSDLCIYC